jgi:Rrf2 family protein
VGLGLKWGEKLKLTKKSEYACLALLTLTEAGDKLVTIGEISRQKNIPKKYLEQILVQLKTAGYVQSIKGKDGGYRLSRQAEKITLAEIVRLIDGALAPVESVSEYFYASTPIEQSPKLLEVFRDIRDYVAGKLEKTTFADLVEISPQKGDQKNE